MFDDAERQESPPGSTQWIILAEEISRLRSDALPK